MYTHIYEFEIKTFITKGWKLCTQKAEILYHSSIMNKFTDQDE